MSQSTREANFIDPKVIYFNVAFTQVKRGTLDGCQLCQQIEEQLDREDASLKEYKDDELVCVTLGHPGQGGEYDLQLINPIYVVNKERGRTKWANRTYSEGWSYYCFAEEHSPASNFNTTRPVVIDPASDESL